MMTKAEISFWGCIVVAGGLILTPALTGLSYGAAGEGSTPQWVQAMIAHPDSARAIAAGNGMDWCQTQVVFSRRNPATSLSLEACPTEGLCDNAATRDANIPDSTAPPLWIRLKFNVFRKDDGSIPAATQADVDAQVAQLNADYLPARIQFVYTTQFINSSQFRSLTEAEKDAMKSTYADLPAEQINIYVVNIQAGYLGVGTFPWDSFALGPLGGVIVDDDWFGAGQKTLTHELGHNLGLWHTHHGVSEVTQCGSCYERADGSNGDFTGDFCSDTDPTPTNYNCSGPGGTDPCSSVPWGPTDPQNYMGYAPDGCYTEFSPQQWGRMHCWITNVLSGWLAIGFSATPVAGSESLNASFTYDSPLNTLTWKWYFGDGDSAMVANPTHVYGPGLFDVTLQVTTDVGDMTAFKENYITVWADTMSAIDIAVGAESAGYWEIQGTNAVPLTEIIFPVSLTNVPSVLFFDSISFVGTRLEYFESSQVVFDNRFLGQLAVRAVADAGGGSPPLPPGSGPVARIYFRTRANATVGDTSHISFAPLGTHSFSATTLTTSFEPVFNEATLTIIIPPCDCSAHGDVAGDDGLFDSVDLSALIDRVFNAGLQPPIDPLCPHIDRGDVNCDGTDDAIDVSYMVDLVFFNGQAPCDPCGCDPYPSNCP